MASTIIGLFKSKPKATTPAAAATPAKGPIITQLGTSDQTAMALRRKLVGGQAGGSMAATGILSNKLGG